LQRLVNKLSFVSREYGLELGSQHKEDYSFGGLRLNYTATVAEMATYWRESWTIKAADCNRLNVFA